MFYLVQLLVPIAICVVLPVMIVWLFSRSKINKDNRNAEIILKALETNSSVDTDKLVEALSKPRRTLEQLQQRRLLLGCIFTLIGFLLGALSAVIGITEYFENQNLYAYLQTESLDDLIFLIFISGVSLAIGIGYLVVYFVTRKSCKNGQVHHETTN